MDDILVLAPTRWKLRMAVRIVNESLAALGLEKHPDKTFIGRVEKGFDFLGYRLGPKGLTVAKQTRERFAANVRPGFTSKSAAGGFLPARSGRTCGVGSGGRQQGSAQRWSMVWATAGEGAVVRAVECWRLASGYNRWRLRARILTLATMATIPNPNTIPPNGPMDGACWGPLRTSFPSTKS